LSKEDPAEGGEDASEETEPVEKYCDFLGVVLGLEPFVGFADEGLIVEGAVGRGEELRRVDCREEGVRAEADEVLGVVAVEDAR